jgi:hypothetical protein
MRHLPYLLLLAPLAAPASIALQQDDSYTVRRQTALRAGPEAKMLGQLSNGVTVQLVARDRGWARVRVEGWVREADLVPSDTALRPSLSAADLRSDPVAAQGKIVQWTVEFLALQSADPLRHGLADDEPYILARGPGSENAILYLVIPPSLMSAGARGTERTCWHSHSRSPEPSTPEMTPSSPAGPNTDRHAIPGGRDRRREAWRTFRHAYPTFLRVLAVLFLLLVAVDVWLIARHFTYKSEITRLRAGMTEAERQRSDLVIQSEQDKLRVALELAKHQAQFDPKLHLSIAVDSGRMYLLRDGALLRDMVVAVAPEHAPGVKGDTTAAAVPRGQRTIVDIKSDDTLELILNGGTRIYADADSGVATPGNIRVNPNDLKAVLPNLSAGMSVYLY